MALATARPAASTVGVVAGRADARTAVAARSSQPVGHDGVGQLSLDDIAGSILERATGEAGVRTMVAGATSRIDARAEAGEIASWLAADGADVVVIEWSPMGSRGTASGASAHGLGLNDLLAGNADFESIIVADPENACHRINAGSPRQGDDAFDVEEVNLLLDALDDVYGQIIVTGDHRDCQRLFEATEGRFDVAVSIVEVGARGAEAGGYLGFEVCGMPVLTYERRSRAARAVSRARAREFEAI